MRGKASDLTKQVSITAPLISHLRPAGLLTASPPKGEANACAAHCLGAHYQKPSLGGRWRLSRRRRRRMREKKATLASKLGLRVFPHQSLAAVPLRDSFPQGKPTLARRIARERTTKSLLPSWGKERRHGAFLTKTSGSAFAEPPFVTQGRKPLFSLSPGCSRTERRGRQR